MLRGGAGAQAAAAALRPIFHRGRLRIVDDGTEEVRTMTLSHPPLLLGTWPPAAATAASAGGDTRAAMCRRRSDRAWRTGGSWMPSSSRPPLKRGECVENQESRRQTGRSAETMRWQRWIPPSAHDRRSADPEKCVPREALVNHSVLDAAARDPPACLTA